MNSTERRKAFSAATAFPEAINSVFPQTKIQLCIVHMTRNSVKYVSWKDRKEICADLKKVYLNDSDVGDICSSMIKKEKVIALLESIIMGEE
jgi:hypothetical protein